LAVAPQKIQERSDRRPPGTTAPGATPAQSPPIPWWARVVLFICCASRQATQIQQQEQSQAQAHGHVQVQPSSSHTEPAATSMSTTPSAPPTSTTPPNAANVQSQPFPLRARFVLSLCCVSITR
jgi:hypothetical protein